MEIDGERGMGVTELVD